VKRSASLLVLLLFLSLVLPTFSVPLVRAADDSWTTMAPPPTPFYSNIGAAVVDGKIYFIGSQINAKYDPETNTWVSIASPPTYNGWGSVVACQNKIYLIGGNASKPTQVYNPATDIWENKTSIPTSRIYQQANVVGNKIYVISGSVMAPLGVVTFFNSNDVYDPETDSWSEMEPIPTPVEGYASAVLDDKIYIIGGGVAGVPGEYLPTNQVQIFNPETNQWTDGTPIPTGLCYARACVTTGLLAPKRIYVIGGSQTYYFRYAYSAVTDLNQMYDPETDTWTNATSMPTPRCKFGIAVVNDEIYTIGGHNSTDQTVVISVNEKYTPMGFIPEFPQWIILPLLITATVVAIICKQKLPKNR